MKKIFARLNPFGFGLIGWIWKCALSPIGFIFMIFGYTPPELEDEPDPDLATFRMVLLPAPGVDKKKLLKTGNEIFRAFGAENDYVANGLAHLQEAFTNGQSGDIWDHFSIYVTQSQRTDLLKHLKGSSYWRVYYDEYKHSVEVEQYENSWRKRRAAVKEAAARSEDSICTYLEDEAIVNTAA